MSINTHQTKLAVNKILDINVLMDITSTHNGIVNMILKYFKVMK